MNKLHNSFEVIEQCPLPHIILDDMVPLVYTGLSVGSVQLPDIFGGGSDGRSIRVLRYCIQPFWRLIK